MSVVLSTLAMLVLLSTAVHARLLEDGNLLNSGSLSALGNKFRLAWELYDDRVAFTMNVDTVGYFGVGIGPSMSDGDMYIARFLADDDGQLLLTDHFSDSNGVPLEDVELGGSDDLHVISSSQQDGVSEVSFWRLLETGDEQWDRAISTTGYTQLLLAFHPTQWELVNHGRSARAAVEVELAVSGGAARAVDSASRTTAVHGVFMTFMWAFVAPVAAAVARYRKHRRWWLVLHSTLFTLIMTASIPLATSSVNVVTSFTEAHGLVGAALANAVILQYGAGLYLQHLMAQQRLPKPYRRLRSCHRMTGYLLIALSLLLVGIGIQLGYPETGLTTYYTVFASLLTAMALLHEAARRLPWMAPRLRWLRRAASVEATYRSSEGLVEEALPAMNADMLQEQIFLGKQLVLYERYVCDISPFVNVHPGGAGLIFPVLGTDVSPYITGSESVHGDKNSHSEEAMAQLRECRVARFVHSAARARKAGVFAAEDAALTASRIALDPSELLPRSARSTAYESAMYSSSAADIARAAAAAGASESAALGGGYWWLEESEPMNASHSAVRFRFSTIGSPELAPAGSRQRRVGRVFSMLSPSGQVRLYTSVLLLVPPERRHNTVDLVVTRHDGGHMWKHLAHLARWDKVQLLGPRYQSCPLPQPGADVCIACHGAAVNPFVELLDILYGEGSDMSDDGRPQKLQLFYCSRTQEDVVFSDFLDGIAKRHDSVTVHYVIKHAPASFTGLTGKLNSKLLQPYVSPGSCAYVCGSNDFVTKMTATFRSLLVADVVTLDN